MPLARKTNCERGKLGRVSSPTAPSARAFRILVIEDDAAIRRGLVDTLKFESFEVFEAGNVNAGLDLALAVECDLILLDLLLPGGDGLSILARVREVRPTLPVIILTARGDEADRVKGLQTGADDYVVKPFSPRELVARVRAVLRRSPERPLDVASIRYSSVEVDFGRREVRHDGNGSIDLSEKEVDLLRYLAANHGRAIHREELLKSVWQIDPNGADTRTVDMHVARLRDKLKDPADNPRLLLTARGIGYLLAHDVQLVRSKR